jgi:hypothetical protein
MLILQNSYRISDEFFSLRVAVAFFGEQSQVFLVSKKKSPVFFFGEAFAGVRPISGLVD